MVVMFGGVIVSGGCDDGCWSGSVRLLWWLAMVIIGGVVESGGCYGR